MKTKITILIAALFLSFGAIAQTVEIEGDPYDGNPYASIADAVEDAEDGDVILISGIHTESVTISKSITLRGSDPTVDIIQASESASNSGNGSRVLFLERLETSDNLTITIENLGIRHGNSSANGGGIFVDKVTGLATLKNLIIEDNHSEANGGGVAMAGSNVLLIESTVQNNSSTLDGGGILAAANNATTVDSSIEIKQSLIHNNSGRNGGGIFINGNQGFGDTRKINVLVENSTISENDSFSPAGGNGGGGIWTRSALWLGDNNSTNVSLQLVHATVYNNTHASLTKNGLQFNIQGGNPVAAADVSVYNSIIVSGTDVAEKAFNFLNANLTDMVNTILGGTENAGPFNSIIDDENKNNDRGRTSIFAGLGDELTDEGGSTLVFALAEGSAPVNYCTATVPITLPGIDQRGATRTATPDAGAFEFGVTLSTETFLAQENDFVMYPNPASNQVNFKSELPIEEIRIFSITGKLQRVVKNLHTVDVSDFQNGVYIVKLSNGTSTKTQKLVVKH